MNTQMPFIDRIEQLSLIEDAINERGKRQIIYIRADGGIGKTRLLQEVRNRYRRWDAALLANRANQSHLTIAVVNEFTHTEWAERFLQGVEKVATEMDIRLLKTDANHDFNKMADDLNASIQASPDAIILRLGTDERLRSGIENAFKAGIPILTVDNYLPHLTSVTSSITTDEHEGAYLSNDQLVKDIKSRGKVLALLATGVAMQEKRKNLLNSLLSQYSNNIDLVVEEVSLISEMSKSVYEKTLELLRRHPDTKAIWVAWDEFTQGVVNALEDANRSEIGVYSFDPLSPQDIDLMSKNNSPWRSTVTIDPASVGGFAVQLAASAACKKPIENHYSMPMQYVSQSELRRKKDKWLSIWENFEFEQIPGLLIPEVIDFDEYAFRQGESQSIEIRLADLIGPQHFHDFFQELRQYNDVKEAQISEEIIKKHESQAQRTFIGCLKKITEQQRIILLIDTAEKTREDLHFILDLISEIDNIVILLAGRPDSNTENFLKDAVGSQIQIIDLPPLRKDASKHYLEEKQKILNVVLKPSLAQKLLYLAGGKPILIDLAVEWCVRKDPMDLLVKKSLAVLKNLSDEEKKRLRTDFEAQLVHRVAQTRTDLDLLILMLAQVYPLDVSMLADLLKISKKEAEERIKEGQGYVYVKMLPNGRITLHDEMRRLINTYAWPEVDSEKEWRFDISQAAAEYLKKQKEEYGNRIEKLKESMERQPRNRSLSTALAKWRDYHDCLEELWMLKEHLLRHLLIVDIEAGMELFVGMFDDATKIYRYTPRMDWISQVEAFADKLSPFAKYQVFIRKAKALLDDGRYTDAKQILGDVRNLATDTNQQVDVRIQLANVLIRQGDLSGGIEIFKEAVEISKTHDLKSWLVKAENGLGWAYRLTANLEAALEHYEVALGLAIELELDHEQAMLYNNLGFICAYRRDLPNYYDIAQRYCNESLRLAQKLEDKRGIGRAYSALGCISFMGGEAAKSLDYFQKALDIFEPSNDEEWLCIIYSWRGAVYIGEPYLNFGLAEKDLLRAREINISKEQPMVLSRLGLIYLLKGNLLEAEKAILECRRLALELPDYSYQWVSIRDLARLDRYKKDYGRLDELEQEMNQYVARHPKPDNRAWGMLHMELGNLALGRGKEDKATEHYYQGMKILTTIGNYGGDSPQTYLERLEKEVFIETLKLSPSTIRAIGAILLRQWQAELLHIHHPDIRAIFSRWANFEEVKA